MSRREIPVGMAEKVREYGTPLWETERAALRGYVRGRYSDEGPLSAMLWSDLRSAYARHGIHDCDATMFELRLAQVSFRRLGKMFGLDESTVRQQVDAVERAIMRDSRLGLITTIVEECGGWGTVGAYLFA